MIVSRFVRGFIMAAVGLLAFVLRDVATRSPRSALVAAAGKLYARVHALP